MKGNVETTKVLSKITTLDTKRKRKKIKKKMLQSEVYAFFSTYDSTTLQARAANLHSITKM